ncbi:MAG: flotillin-like FloA family protein, partial [bacterium]|nr:flotillin-like FloA family protein [bacterium]
MIAVGFGGLLVTLLIFLGVVIFLYYFPFGLWLSTIAAGVPLSIIALVRMRLIRIPPGVIVNNLVRARKAGLSIDIDQLQ